MDEILEKLIDYSLSISINDYQFNETLIKIVYLNNIYKEMVLQLIAFQLYNLILGI